MPFKSKAQQRFMFASEAEGELPKGTAKRWANETEKKKGGIEALPERVKSSKKTAGEIAKIAVSREMAMRAITQRIERMGIADMSPEDSIAAATDVGLKYPKTVKRSLNLPPYLWDYASPGMRARAEAEAAAHPSWPDYDWAAAHTPSAVSSSVTKSKLLRNLGIGAGALAAAHTPSAVSSSVTKSKLLRNLGIGAGALGLAGLGGYGAYRALRKDDRASQKEGRMKKSASEMAKVALTRWQKEVYKNPEVGNQLFPHSGSPAILQDLSRDYAGGLDNPKRHLVLPSEQQYFRGVGRRDLQDVRSRLRNLGPEDSLVTNQKLRKLKANELDFNNRINKLKSTFPASNPTPPSIPSPSNYLNLGANGGKQTLKRPAWLSSDVPVPAELENALKDFRASKAAPVAAAPAAAAAAEAVPQAASQAASKAVPQAASKMNPRLLRNLGIGGAALGAAGLGGYGLYRAFRKDGGGSKKEGSIQKSFFKFSAGEAAAVTPWQQGFMDASAKLAPPGMLNASADVAQAQLQKLRSMGGVSADAFSNLPTIGGNANVPIIGDYSKADVPILRGPERPANPTSRVTATVPQAIPKAAPAVAEAATTGAEAAAKAAPAVSKLNPKLLRNLGIGGAAVGALGLGGYGLYQAAKGNKKSKESQADMRKSAAEIAEKVCTPEEKAKCCEGESSKKDEKKSEGNPFAKKDEGNPFEKKEAAGCGSSPKPKKKSPKDIAAKVMSSQKK